VFTSPHPVNPNREPGESVLHLDTPVYLRSASGKAAENLSEGLNKYYLWLRLLTYLLTPWSRVLLEKLNGSAASQEIPRIFGTRKFITVPTSARHLSLP